MLPCASPHSGSLLLTVYPCKTFIQNTCFLVVVEETKGRRLGVARIVSYDDQPAIHGEDNRLRRES